MNKPSISPLDPRLRFAAERTVLSWIRTGLTIMTLGFAIGRFHFSEQKAEFDTVSAGSTASMWVGSGLLVIGSFTLLFAGYRYHQVCQHLKRGKHPPDFTWSAELVLTLLLAGLGV